MYSKWITPQPPTPSIMYLLVSTWPQRTVQFLYQACDIGLTWLRFSDLCLQLPMKTARAYHDPPAMHEALLPWRRAAGRAGGARGRTPHKDEHHAPSSHQVKQEQTEHRSPCGWPARPSPLLQLTLALLPGLALWSSLWPPPPPGVFAPPAGAPGW